MDIDIYNEIKETELPNIDEFGILNWETINTDDNG